MPRIPFALLSLTRFAPGAASPAAARRPEDHDYQNLAFRGPGPWPFGVFPAPTASAASLEEAHP